MRAIELREPVGLEPLELGAAEVSAARATISNKKNLSAREIGPRRGWPDATAECLLSLAAAPTFLIMALLSGLSADGMPSLLCPPARAASPLTGMVAMYSLMTAFHLRPWLGLLSARR